MAPGHPLRPPREAASPSQNRPPRPVLPGAAPSAPPPGHSRERPRCPLLGLWGGFPSPGARKRTGRLPGGSRSPGPTAGARGGEAQSRSRLASHPPHSHPALLPRPPNSGNVRAPPRRTFFRQEMLFHTKQDLLPPTPQHLQALLRGVSPAPQRGRFVLLPPGERAGVPVSARTRVSRTAGVSSHRSRYREARAGEPRRRLWDTGLVWL